MKTHLFFSLLLILFLGSCNRSASLQPNEDRQALYQRFHGKYRIISSVSNEAIDLNLDGVAGVNLKEEYADLVNADLEVRMLPSAGRNYFMESWPEPHFSGLGGDAPGVYDPAISVMYANQGVTRTFTFDAEFKNLLLDPDDASIDLQQHTRPASVIIKAGNFIEVTKTKRFILPVDGRLSR